MNFSGPPGRSPRATTRHVRGLPPKPHEQRVFYFVYSEDLNPSSVKLMAPSSRYQTHGFLPDHRLMFGALPATGFDGETEVAHTTVIPAPASKVLGFVYSIERGDLERIDRRKRAPKLYERSSHRILLPQDSSSIGDGTGVIAITHVLKPSMPPRPPSAHTLQTLKQAYASVGYELRLG